MNSIVLINRVTDDTDKNVITAAAYYNTPVIKDLMYNGKLITKRMAHDIYRDLKISNESFLHAIKLKEKGLTKLFDTLCKAYPSVTVDMGQKGNEDIYNDMFLIPLDELDKLVDKIHTKERIDRYINDLSEYEKNKSETSKFKNTKTVKTVKRTNRFKNGQIAKVTLATLLMVTGFRIGTEAAMDYLSRPEENTPPSVVQTQEEPKEDLILDTDKQVVNIINDASEHTLKGVQKTSQKMQKIDYKMCFEADDWINDENYNQKYIDCKENYYESIERIAKIYGIDPDIALAIACHERGYHSGTVDSGGGLGLYQIQIEGSWNWDGKDVTAYNFETNTYETYTINKEDIRDLDNNIKAAMMIFQNCLTSTNYNLPRALQQYNYGISYMNTVIDRACEVYGVNRDYFNNPEHMEWLNQRNIIRNGDALYLEHLGQFMINGDTYQMETPEHKIIIYQFVNTKIDNELSNPQFLHN